MQLHRFSVRVSIVVGMAVMAMLAVFLVWMSGGVYRSFIIQSQRDALSEQLRGRLNDLRHELDAKSGQVVTLARATPGLTAAVESRKAGLAAGQLDILFDRSGSDLTRIKLARLQVFDGDFNELASSAQGVSGSILDQPSCRAVRYLIMKRKLSERQTIPSGKRLDTQSVPSAYAPKTVRITPASGFCVADKNIYHLLVESLGDRATAGYLLVTTDVMPKLIGPDNIFAMPARLSLGDGTVLYRSPRWFHDEDSNNNIVAEQLLGTLAPARTTLVVAVSRDIQPLNARLTDIARQVTAAATAVALSAALLLWFALRRMAVRPLQKLLTQMRRVRSDKKQLGEHVTVDGNAEVAELGAGFNELTTRLKDLYANIENIAFTDPLTKLPNRTLFYQRLREAIESAKQDYKPFAVFIMDLDRFKDINDTLGHPAGDELLEQVAARLRGKLRDIDTLARMGGDEFGILLPAVNEKHAAMAARMLLQALRMPFQVTRQTLDVGASIGITLYPDHGVDANLLIQRADVAMYAAKNSNGGHAFYDGEQDHHSPTRLTMLGELRHAVEQEQFVLYFQPKVNLKTYQVTGVEALVRWNHPRENLVLPDTFVPLMEQTGLIRSLTPWVLTESLKQGQALQDQGLPISISMNLSVRDLQDPYLADAVGEQLAALQISPRWLELEITESAVMTDPDRAFEILTRLATMGLRIAIDDFGTGYSSLSYLKKLPVSTIKIDKSFVLGMTRNENDAAIVRTSIDLGHNLGLEVVAEGVEAEDVLKRLSELGCDTAQGHYISRPLSVNEFTDWLKQSSWGLAKRNPKLVRWLHN
ncbi:MAG: putative bifunctional diguanylate cyclase/phosphodiesterase [Bacteroidota bacterium]